MSRIVRPSGMRRLVLTLVALAVVLVPGRADALSCASPVDQSPETVATGDARTSSGQRFGDVYAGVVFGRVIRVSPNGSFDLIDVDVTGWFGDPLPTRVSLQLDNVAGGPSLRQGEHLYLPYFRKEGQLRLPLCGPMEQIDPARVPALMATARAGAWPSTGSPRPLPTVASEPIVRLAEPERYEKTTSSTAVALGVFAVLALTLVVTSRRLPPQRPWARRTLLLMGLLGMPLAAAWWISWRLGPEFHEHQGLWQRRAPERYSFTYITGGDSGRHALRVTVDRGRVTGTEPVLGFNAPRRDEGRTVDALFDELAHDLRFADEVRVTYDGYWGFPQSVGVDEETLAKDDEHGYGVEQFTPLSGPEPDPDLSLEHEPHLCDTQPGRAVSLTVQGIGRAQVQVVELSGQPVTALTDVSSGRIALATLSTSIPARVTVVFSDEGKELRRQTALLRSRTGTC